MLGWAGCGVRNRMAIVYSTEYFVTSSSRLSGGPRWQEGMAGWGKACRCLGSCSAPCQFRKAGRERRPSGSNKSILHHLEVYISSSHNAD